MTVLELKKEIDDYIEAGGDKYCPVVMYDVGLGGEVRLTMYMEPDGWMCLEDGWNKVETGSFVLSY